MTNARTILTTLIGFSLLALGCSAGPESGEAGGAPSSLSRQSACAQTLCEQIQDDCTSYIDECFGQCYGMSGEFMYQCISLCNDYECSPCTVNECAEQTYAFEISSPRDESVFAACERYHAKATQCGSDTTAIDCDRFSRLERPEAAAAYDCYAGLTCGAEGASCEPAPTSWGLELCLALNAKCYYADLGCTKEQADQLNAAAAWLKDDVRAEAMRCLDEYSCSDVEACVGAWSAAVFQ